MLIARRRLLAWRRRLTQADLLLLCFTLPPLAIVTVQAFVSRANANWSGASYLPGAILVAAWLIRWRARKTLLAALAIQALVAVVFLSCVLSPPDRRDPGGRQQPETHPRLVGGDPAGA